jgi:hypothetical protein
VLSSSSSSSMVVYWVQAFKSKAYIYVNKVFSSRSQSSYTNGLVLGIVEVKVLGIAVSSRQG